MPLLQKPEIETEEEMSIFQCLQHFGAIAIVPF